MKSYLQNLMDSINSAQTIQKAAIQVLCKINTSLSRTKQIHSKLKKKPKLYLLRIAIPELFDDYI